MNPGSPTPNEPHDPHVVSKTDHHPPAHAPGACNGRCDHPYDCDHDVPLALTPPMDGGSLPGATDRPSSLPKPAPRLAALFRVWGEFRDIFHGYGLFTVLKHPGLSEAFKAVNEAVGEIKVNGVEDPPEEEADTAALASIRRDQRRLRDDLSREASGSPWRAEHNHEEIGDALAKLSKAAAAHEQGLAELNAARDLERYVRGQANRSGLSEAVADRQLAEDRAKALTSLMLKAQRDLLALWDNPGRESPKTGAVDRRLSADLGVAPGSLPLVLDKDGQETRLSRQLRGSILRRA